VVKSLGAQTPYERRYQNRFWLSAIEKSLWLIFAQTS
jgi:hypothetical protein